MDEDIEILRVALEQLLTERSMWTEHELIEVLQAPPYELFEADALRQPLSLFQTHFLIFHCRYRIRCDWLAAAKADLEINTLRIQTLPWQAGESGLQQQDPLADYYLDLTQLTGTDEAGVEALLNDFWDNMSAGRRGGQETMDFESACELMDVAPPLCQQTLKRQYRRLIHRHHPDKGGSLKKMQDVKKAYHTLARQM